MNRSDPTNLHAMMSGDDRSGKAALFRSAAGVVSPVYDLAVRVRNNMFDRGIRKQHRAHVPVVSIGNITTGGTGKTPMVIEVLRRLQQLGATPAVLTRGYKADARGFSDEAELMKLKLPGVPVIVNADRVAGAKQIQTDHAAVTVIVLDDGFQHRRIARDIDIVLIDATCPFGFDHVLPRGMLREPAEGLRRASGVIVTKCESVDAQLDERIGRYHGKLPLGHVTHRWTAVVDEHDQPVNAADARRVLAFAGIGRPETFFAEARRRFDVADAIALADHAVYDDATCGTLREGGQRLNVDALLTTEKDWVKLQPRIQSLALGRPVWRAVLGLEWRDGSDELNGLLQQVVR